MNSLSLYEYDLAHNPLNFEFLVWLINMEMTRKRHNAPAPLRIRFTNVESVEAEKWLFNVFRPLLPMIGAVEDESENVEVPFKLFLSVEHLLESIVAGVKWGEEVPRLRASDTFRVFMRGCSPIVITLREAEHWPHRNSNLEAWKKFAVDLEAAGEQVVFVRDTAKANEPFGPFLTYSLASRDLDARMALYETAKMNFFVSNGPVGMAIFSRVPYTYFMTQYPGAQPPRWPWAAENQRVICAVDSYENLLAEWEKGALSGR